MLKEEYNHCVSSKSCQHGPGPPVWGGVEGGEGERETVRGRRAALYLGRGAIFHQGRGKIFNLRSWEILILWMKVCFLGGCCSFMWRISGDHTVLLSWVYCWHLSRQLVAKLLYCVHCVILCWATQNLKEEQKARYPKRRICSCEFDNNRAFGQHTL